MYFQRFLTSLDKHFFGTIFILAIGIFAYSVILMIGIQEAIKLPLSTPDCTFLFLGITLLLFFAYRPSGWMGSLTSYTSTLILFAWSLSASWPETLNWRFAGLLPKNDANGYYISALRFLEGTTFNVAGSYRPLSHGVLASILGLTQQNLQLTLAILTFITATACYFLAREVQRSHGTASGVLVLTLLFMFDQSFIGSVMTENWGLTLGAVGLAILWRGLLSQGINLCLLGIFLLTLALNTRAGVFLVLPALIIWGTWSFRGRSRFSWHFLIGGSSAILLGFLINSLVFKLVAQPGVEANSNFAATLYGMLVGGNWTTRPVDNPDATSNEMYQLAFEALRANPLALILGYVRAWKQFLLENYIFAFVRSLAINITLQLLSFIVLINAIRQRQTTLGSFIIASTLGILLSLPFAPPWDAGDRIYAATIPIFSLFPALGLAYILRKVPWKPQLQIIIPNESPQLVLIFGMGLALLTFISPIGIKLHNHIPHFDLSSCPSGTEAVYFRNSRGSSIHLVSDNAIKRSYIPQIRITDFRTLISNSIKIYPEDLLEDLEYLNAETTLVSKINLSNGAGIWLIAPSNLIPKEKGIVGACGKSRPKPDDSWLHGTLFFVESMTFISH